MMVTLLVMRLLKVVLALLLLVLLPLPLQLLPLLLVQCWFAVVAVVAVVCFCCHCGCRSGCGYGCAAAGHRPLIVEIGVDMISLMVEACNDMQCIARMFLIAKFLSLLSSYEQLNSCQHFRKFCRARPF